MFVGKDDHVVFDHFYPFIGKPVKIGIIPEDLETLPYISLDGQVIKGYAVM